MLQWKRTGLRVVYVTAVGVVVLFGTGYALRPVQLPAEKADYKFLHCDKCFKEIPFAEHMLEKQCPYCKESMKGTMTPTRESILTHGSPWRWYYSALSFELVGLLGVVVYVLYNPPREDESKRFEHIKCPRCRRRLRYLAESEGKTGECPRCHYRFVYQSEPLLGEK